VVLITVLPCTSLRLQWPYLQKVYVASSFPQCIRAKSSERVCNEPTPSIVSPKIPCLLESPLPRFRHLVCDLPRDPPRRLLQTTAILASLLTKPFYNRTLVWYVIF
jgi:hypothetical protein